ncbi:MAG TPA: cytochrome P450 [Rubrivivax sp.]|nr:cytochrome P450 [Rubrivivax sp.]
MAASATEAAAREGALRFTLAAAGADFVADPYPTYDALRTHDPVHRLAEGSWLLTRHADVLALYREPAASSDKQREFGAKFGIGTPLHEHHTTSLVFNDPPLHTRVRRLLMGALDQRAIQRMQPGVEALVETLIDRLHTLPAPDLVSDFAACIPVEVIGNLLGVPHDERGPLRDWSLAILGALEPAPDAAMLAHGHAAVTAFKDYLRGLVAQRRRHPGDPSSDVLTRLIEGEVGGERLSETELLHNCIFLLNAGHETTTNLIGNGAHALLTHRDQWQRLLDQPALLPAAVEELLRFESPLQLNNRLLGCAVRVGDVELPAGDFVTLALGAANRDPEVFAQPHALDVARKPNPHLAFGQGHHACAGMNVARLEARIAFGRLLQRCPRLELAGTPQRETRIRFRGFKSLPVRLG